MSTFYSIQHRNAALVGGGDGGDDDDIAVIRKKVQNFPEKNATHLLPVGGYVGCEQTGAQSMTNSAYPNPNP